MRKLSASAFIHTQEYIMWSIPQHHYPTLFEKRVGSQFNWDPEDSISGDFCTFHGLCRAIAKITDYQQGGLGFSNRHCRGLNRRSVRKVQLVKYLTADQEVLCSIPDLVEGSTEGVWSWGYRHPGVHGFNRRPGRVLNFGRLSFATPSLTRTLSRWSRPLTLYRGT